MAVAVAVTIAAVVACGSACRRLHSWADQAVFGERVSGHDLLTQFGTTLGHAYRLDELAPQMAAALVRGLGLAWARLSLLVLSQVGRREEALAPAQEAVTIYERLAEACACPARTGSWLPGSGHRTVPASRPGRVAVVRRWPGMVLVIIMIFRGGRLRSKVT